MPGSGRYGAFVELPRTEIERVFSAESPGGPENAAGFVMWRLVRRYLRGVDRALAPLGLTHLKFQALALTAWLSRTEPLITQARLSDFSDIQPMQVSLLLKALEKDGMVTRSRGKADPRVKVITLTAEGWQAVRDALPIVVAEERQFFGADAGPDAVLHATLMRLDRTHRDVPADALTATPSVRRPGTA